jgi:hypothetical protein
MYTLHILIQVYLTDQIYFDHEWLTNSFELLNSALHYLPLEMKITIGLLFFNVDKCVQKLWFTIVCFPQAHKVEFKPNYEIQVLNI